MTDPAMMETIIKYGIILLLAFCIYKAGKGIKKIIGIILALYIAYLVAGYMGVI